jgi:hypothetical protein
MGEQADAFAVKVRELLGLEHIDPEHHGKDDGRGGRWRRRGRSFFCNQRRGGGLRRRASGDHEQAGASRASEQATKSAGGIQSIRHARDQRVPGATGRGESGEGRGTGED